MAFANEVIGNFIGLKMSGMGSLGNEGSGIVLRNQVAVTLIGDGTHGGNFISGNFGDGIRLEVSGSPNESPDFNCVSGNHIGTSVPGSGSEPTLLKRIPNGGAGVRLVGEPHNQSIFGNEIGGPSPVGMLGMGNVISGNSGPGVWLGPGASETVVQGNYIGVDRSMLGVLPNGGEAGLVIDERTEFNIIGGPEDQLLRVGNVISGNWRHGVLIRGPETLQFMSNLIGTDVSGTRPMGNTRSGIVLSPGNDSVIGGLELWPNIIAANGGNGIKLIGTNGGEISFNLIGTGPAFRQGPGNALVGVYLTEGSTLNRIFSNEIGLNGADGVRVDGIASIRNTITVNSIFGNGLKGIETINGGNQELPPPTAEVVTLALGQGETCPGCTVELFSDQENEGEIFEMAVTADAEGKFAANGAFQGPEVTCTTTDLNGNTSEFSHGPPDVVPPGLLITKRDTDVNGGDLNRGDILAYEIIIQNNTGTAFQDVAGRPEFEDPIPRDSTYIKGSLTVNFQSHDDATGDGIGFEQATDRVIWNGSIPSNTTLTIRFQVRVSRVATTATIIRNQGQLVVGVGPEGSSLRSWFTDDPDTPELDDPTDAMVNGELVLGDGDVGGDGVTDLSDASLLQDFLLDRIQFSETQLASADVNGDGRVDVLDLIALVNLILEQ